MKYSKKLSVFYFSFHVFTFALSQDATVHPQEFPDPVTLKIQPQHCSLQAALLLQDLKKGKPTITLKTKYILYDSGSTVTVPALMRIGEDFDSEQLKKLGVHKNTDLGNILSVHVPIDRYEELINVPGIIYFELAKKVESRLDKALTDSRVDLVHQGINLSRAYTGKNVVIGVIDYGFDYTHPTFHDLKTGGLRIKKVWEQNMMSGNPPAGYAYGRELKQEGAILNAEKDNSISGHGTHVAAIATGSGGSLSDKYRGVAYESDIVLVSLKDDEGVGGLNTGIVDGINYIFQYAESVGKPAVINISQGHHTGPHDGSSLTDQAIDAQSGPGRIIVGAVGNEGDEAGFYLHFDHTFNEEPTILTNVVWPAEISAGRTLVDIWGEAGSDFQVNLEIFNPQTKRQEGSGVVFHSGDPVSLVSGMIIDLEGDTLHYEGGIEVNPLNNRPHAQLYIDNTAQSKGDDVDLENLLDNDFVQIRFQASKGTVHAYAANNSGEAFFTDLSGIGAAEFIEDVRVKGGNPRSTMGELGGTAHAIISVGGYTTKNSFTNILGEMFTIEDVVGAQYFKSSQGPTLDGRIKPDICAPANLLTAAENSFNQNFDESLGVDKIDKGNGSEWKFGIRRGTSAAAPMVAGIIAFMLEVDPDLTPDLARELLIANATQDDFTGHVPNQIWGYGKVDAAAVMSSLDQPTGTKFLDLSEQIDVFPNPNRGTFILESAWTGPMNIRIINTSSQILFEMNLESHYEQSNISVSDLPGGIYFLHIKQRDQLFQKKLIVVD